MNIDAVSLSQPMKPSKPMAPIPPPGGNVENRQAPNEPAPPAEVQKNSTEQIALGTQGQGDSIDILA